jgi:hypothetical protein
MTPDTIRKIKFYWAATIAIGFTIFFFVDLALYFGFSEEATLSSTLRTVLQVESGSVKDIYLPMFSFLCGVWFSHFFQFGGRAK